jgi:hypothetical protein
MTKKHFIEFAKFIANYSCAKHDRKINLIVRQDMARMIVQVQDNPLFDKTRFLKACGLS